MEQIEILYLVVLLALVLSLIGKHYFNSLIFVILSGILGGLLFIIIFIRVRNMIGETL